nr:hypothetical protein GCM10025732_35380 [Glycomyces mayteni]
MRQLSNRPRARAARLGVGAADHADHEVPGREPAARGGLADPPEGLVPDDEPVGPRWGPAVLAVGELPVGAAHAERDGVDEQLPFACHRLIHLPQLQRPLDAGLHGQRAHAAHLPFHLRNHLSMGARAGSLPVLGEVGGGRYDLK